MVVLPQEIIRRKRDGEALERDQIGALIDGLTSGEISEGQVAAFAMAVFFKGMSAQECVWLTEAMRDSGTVIDWSDLDGPVLDKHSTGGIGDNVSLMLAPALAACGTYVPMISGRGLGHTGGTLDKLDTIPGYQTQPDLERLRAVVAQAGCAIIGQTADLAPADKRLYAIRDVTATVESIPLITASMLSKKLAAGIGGLVLDVKTGSGAFMTSMEDSRHLASSLVSVANGAGMKTSALITDMNEPLASAAGNGVELRNAVDFLTGAHIDPRLHQVTVALGGELLATSGLATDPAAGEDRIAGVFSSGHAAEVFGRMVAALGGPAEFVDKAADYLPVAPVSRDIHAEFAGTVTAVDARAIGVAVVELGGGRLRPDDTIDHAVGFSNLAGLGDEVGPRAKPLARVHARDEAAVGFAASEIRVAYHVGSGAEAAGPVIHDRVRG
jgi:thymidine phosphorylase